MYASTEWPSSGAFPSLSLLLTLCSLWRFTADISPFGFNLDNDAGTQIRLSAINPTNSAFCMFAFDPDFFLAVNTVDSSEKIECQIQLKVRCSPCLSLPIICGSYLTLLSSL